VTTCDNQGVPAEQAVALNVKRLGFVQHLLRERLGLERFANAQLALTNCKDPTRMSTLKVLVAAEALARTIAEKGPDALCFASTESAAATQISEFFGKPDFSIPPKAWGADYKVPELFVSLLQARKDHDEWKEQRARKVAEKEAKRTAAEAKKEVERTAAEAERQRQVSETVSAADFLMSLADDNVVDTMEKKADERLAQREERAKEREDRLAQAKRFFADALLGRLTARGFKSPRGTRWYVSDKENESLSLRRLASLADAPEDLEIWSMVPESTFHGTLGDTWTPEGSDRSKACWMVASFIFNLVTDAGRKVIESGKQVTSNGFVILHSREVTTMRIVAQELGILTWSDQTSERKFWESYHVQPIRFVSPKDNEVKGAAMWAAGVLSGKGRRTSSDNDEVGTLVASADPLDEPAPAAPKADADRDERAPKTAKPKERKSGTHGRTVEEVSFSHANPATKAVPGGHVAEETVTAHKDPGFSTNLGAALLAAAKAAQEK